MVPNAVEEMWWLMGRVCKHRALVLTLQGHIYPSLGAAILVAGLTARQSARDTMQHHWSVLLRAEALSLDNVFMGRVLSSIYWLRMKVPRLCFALNELYRTHDVGPHVRLMTQLHERHPDSKINEDVHGLLRDLIRRRRGNKQISRERIMYKTITAAVIPQRLYPNIMKVSAADVSVHRNLWRLPLRQGYSTTNLRADVSADSTFGDFARDIMKERNWASPNAVTQADACSAFRWVLTYMETLLGQCDADASFRGQLVTDGTVIYNSITDVYHWVVLPSAYGLLVHPLVARGEDPDITLSIDCSLDRVLEYVFVWDVSSGSPWYCVEISHPDGMVSGSCNVLKARAKHSVLAMGLLQSNAVSLQMMDLMRIASGDCGLPRLTGTGAGTIEAGHRSVARCESVMVHQLSLLL